MNTGLRRSEVLLGDSAILASEVQRLAALLTRVVENEISQATLASSRSTGAIVLAPDAQNHLENKGRSKRYPTTQDDQQQQQFTQLAMPQGVCARLLKPSHTNNSPQPTKPTHAL